MTIEYLDLATPANLVSGDEDAYVLGPEFDSSEDGQPFSGVRWYPPSDVLDDTQYHYYAVACTVADSQVVDAVRIHPQPGNTAGWQDFYFDTPVTMGVSGTRYVAGVLLKHYAFTADSTPSRWPQSNVGAGGTITAYRSRLTSSSPSPDTPAFPAVTTLIDFGITPIIGTPDGGPEEHSGSGDLGSITLTLAASGRKVAHGAASLALAVTGLGQAGRKHAKGRGALGLAIVLTGARGSKRAAGAASFGLSIRFRTAHLRARPGHATAGGRVARIVANGRPMSTLTASGE